MKNKYIIIEIQTNADNTVGTLVYDADDFATAQSIYYSKLAAAAVSSLPVHSVILMNNEAFPIKNECFTHEVPVSYNEEN